MNRLQALAPSAGLGRIGLGCAWSYSEHPPGQPEVAALVTSGLDHGVNLLDTAESYGPHLSETLLGRSIEGRREHVLLCTKGGYPRDVATGAFRPDGRPETLRRSCAESLVRLRTEAVDVFYLHRVDPTVPAEESWGALAELVRAGKARGIGICESDLDTIRRLHRIHPITAVQSELSIWTRGALAEIVPWCERNDVAFVAYAPLGRGYLTGSVAAGSQLSEKDFRRRLPRFSDEAVVANRAILQTVRKIAERKQCTPAQIALAWVIAQSDNVYAIPGTRQVERLSENAAAIRVDLTEQDIAELAEIPEPAQPRY